MFITYDINRVSEAMEHGLNMKKCLAFVLYSLLAYNTVQCTPSTCIPLLISFIACPALLFSLSCLSSYSASLIPPPSPLALLPSQLDLPSFPPEPFLLTPLALPPCPLALPPPLAHSFPIIYSFLSPLVLPPFSLIPSSFLTYSFLLAYLVLPPFPS